MNKKMLTEVAQTKAWLEQVIVGLNFCPFAKKELVNNTIRYQVSDVNKIEDAIDELLLECQLLDKEQAIETTLLIYRQGFSEFYDYLDMLDTANAMLVHAGFEGSYQLASFHPDYCFEGEAVDDAANFTNRSPYPTIHIIREASMARVLKNYKAPEEIPLNNIALARAKGSEYFIDLLAKINLAK